MTLDELRNELASSRKSFDDEANLRKDPNITLERLHALYEKLDAAERRMADQVFTEWAISEEEDVRFDALALINDFKIKMAIPELHKLATRLASSNSPGAPYELKKVHRIIVELRP